MDVFEGALVVRRASAVREAFLRPTWTLRSVAAESVSRASLSYLFRRVMGAGVYLELD